MVGGGARMVYVGKEAGYHTRSQAEIHELMLQFAEAGASVVRLKGGDPYVFGRGGEEMQYLRQHGIKVSKLADRLTVIMTVGQALAGGPHSATGLCFLAWPAPSSQHCGPA